MKKGVALYYPLPPESRTASSCSPQSRGFLGHVLASSSARRPRPGPGRCPPGSPPTISPLPADRPTSSSPGDATVQFAVPAAEPCSRWCASLRAGRGRLAAPAPRQSPKSPGSIRLCGSSFISFASPHTAPWAFSWRKLSGRDADCLFPPLASRAGLEMTFL